MYIFDACLMSSSNSHDRNTFNFWTARNFVRQALETKPELGEIITVDNLARQYEVAGFSYHKPNEFEPVLDIVKLRLLP